jgi:hypothetical protein
MIEFIKKYISKFFFSDHRGLPPLSSNRNLNVALLYIDADNAPGTVYDNIRSFKKYSKNNITLIPYNNENNVKNLQIFDVIIIHYYGQIYKNFSKKFLKLLKKYEGLKVFFAQDEYDLIYMNREKYKKAKVDILYSASSVSPEVKEALYPKKEFPYMKVIPYLTGYVSEVCMNDVVPIKERKTHIFYRGNTVGMAYGKVGYEKIEIGRRMKDLLKSTAFNQDIETCITKQIYGKEYLLRMKGAKATLITESGSSVIDWKFQERIKVIEEIKKDPDLPFDYFLKKFPDLYREDGKYVINVIPPKAFEAIMCKTAIIGYEGEYSGILKPNIHYIPLRKDWGNIESVLGKLKDNLFLQKMVDFAFEDIVSSKKYSYEKFIEEFDKKIKKLYLEKIKR